MKIYYHFYLWALVKSEKIKKIAMQRKLALEGLKPVAFIF